MAKHVLGYAFNNFVTSSFMRQRRLGQALASNSSAALLNRYGKQNLGGYVI